MRYVSLFSGVEAATLAWEPLGWEPVAFCEIDAFPSAVLQHHWPDVPNLGDITKVEWGDLDLGAVDLVVGGSPCQSFSVAGGREGLDGESRLMWEYIRAVREIRPRWLLWENVPGVLSIDSGRAFGILLDELAALGYALAWRVLDAQFFGVAQRRQRLFVVGGATGGGAAAVLFDSTCLQGNPSALKEKRQEFASGAGASAAGGSVARRDRAGRPGGGKGWLVQDELSGSLLAHNDQVVVSFAQNQRDEVRSSDVCYTLPAKGGTKGSPLLLVMASDAANAEITRGGLAPTLLAHMAKSAPVLVVSSEHNHEVGDAEPEDQRHQGRGTVPRHRRQGRDAQHGHDI